MRYLGIDFGHAKTGVAIGDDESLMAGPLTTLFEKETTQLVEQLQELIQQESIDALVIGIPYSLDGNESSQTKSSQAFIRTLESQLAIPIHPQDERMSSKHAEILLKEAQGASQYDVHAFAATSILQAFLDRHAQDS